MFEWKIWREKKNWVLFYSQNFSMFLFSVFMKKNFKQCTGSSSKNKFDEILTRERVILFFFFSLCSFALNNITRYTHVRIIFATLGWFLRLFLSGIYQSQLASGAWSTTLEAKAIILPDAWWCMTSVENSVYVYKTCCM